MAIIQCPECGKVISDKAEKCIHCGYLINNGEIITYYDNGNIKSKSNYVDGKEHGVTVRYYENGSIQFRANFKNDKLHGWAFYYDESGKPTSKERYENDVEMETVKID